MQKSICCSIKTGGVMKKVIVLVCLGFVFVLSAPAFAGTQQDKMKGCNKEATGMKGDERKAFMKKCLSKDYTLKADAAAPAPAAMDKKADTKPVASAALAAQQDKMKSCNADAKTKALKGDERKKFMSACLKG